MSYALIGAKIVPGLGLRKTEHQQAAVDELRPKGDTWKWKLDQEMAQPQGQVASDAEELLQT